MIRRPPRSTRTYTLFPYTTHVRSLLFTHGIANMKLLDFAVCGNVSVFVPYPNLPIVGTGGTQRRTCIGNVKVVSSLDFSAVPQVGLSILQKLRRRSDYSLVSRLNLISDLRGHDPAKHRHR